MNGERDFLIPLNDRVVVERMPEETETEGGIIIPESVGEKPARGVIVARGRKVAELDIGDDVLFGKYSGVEVEFLGRELLVMREDDVMAIVKES